MNPKLLAHATIVNRGRSFVGSVLVERGKISAVFEGEYPADISENVEIVDLKGKWILPGVIDDQVHFREPGLTHKGEITTESRAAVAGGVTTFMEMPNTNPQTITQKELQKKFDRAAAVSPSNYSFYIGATNDNLDEVMATDVNNVCGIKIFMGSSTGNMLVDNTEALDKIFKNANLLIATHCEDEATIRANSKIFKDRYGDNVPFDQHPIIRSHEACYLSSSKAVELAKKHDTRLHILHISTGIETNLFGNDVPLEQKRITSEACIHHLWFSDADYAAKGAFIKWNPAVKSAEDRDTIWEALLDDRIDVVATDHAPHSYEEKSGNYWTAPSGGPLIQHSVLAMLDFVNQGRISIERAVEKLSHSPARCYQIKDRGYIEPGMFADLAIVDRANPTLVEKPTLLYKCGWSPFEGHQFNSSIYMTFVNGEIAYSNGEVNDSCRGSAISFSR
ncbi:MAG: dihydroorotase [Flavobacteriales bacterium]|jgi:dihydroorotase|nr:dihydroorotase [Flavobacteriales bacterium]NCG28971.1 dihydroorotase [Bacteroidota bacterium]MBT3963566.1 dihydroorotase [Flavobacteriales bacterium]MBT4706098.1 dihydroorotase [Flavobacteriales bacterium]MBT4930655.1 dihydroorotase [Flavobacteriales bacterium]